VTQSHPSSFIVGHVDNRRPRMTKLPSANSFKLDIFAIQYFLFWVLFSYHWFCDLIVIFFGWGSFLFHSIFCFTRFGWNKRQNHLSDGLFPITWVSHRQTFFFLFWRKRLWAVLPTWFSRRAFHPESWRLTLAISGANAFKLILTMDRSML